MNNTITLNLANVTLKPKIVTNGNWEASSNFQTLRLSFTKLPDISSHCPKAHLQKNSHKTIKPPDILYLCISWKQCSYLHTSKPTHDAQQSTTPSPWNLVDLTPKLKKAPNGDYEVPSFQLYDSQSHLLTYPKSSNLQFTCITRQTKPSGILCVFQNSSKTFS